MSIEPIKPIIPMHDFYKRPKALQKLSRHSDADQCLNFKNLIPKDGKKLLDVLV